MKNLPFDGSTESSSYEKDQKDQRTFQKWQGHHDFPLTKYTICSLANIHISVRRKRDFCVVDTKSINSLEIYIININIINQK